VAQTVSDLNSTYPRGVAAVRLSIPGGGAVVIASTHLALQQDNRMRHAEHLAALVRGAGAPVLVGGDLNETADGAARRFLAPLLGDPAAVSEHTFPAASPSSGWRARRTTCPRCWTSRSELPVAPCSRSRGAAGPCGQDRRCRPVRSGTTSSCPPTWRIAMPPGCSPTTVSWVR